MFEKLSGALAPKGLSVLKNRLDGAVKKVNKKRDEYKDAQVSFAEEKIYIKDQANELRDTADAIDKIVETADTNLAQD